MIFIFLTEFLIVRLLKAVHGNGYQILLSNRQITQNSLNRIVTTLLSCTAKQLCSDLRI